jgi:2-phosphoglycerate kinase
MKLYINSLNKNKELAILLKEKLDIIFHAKIDIILFEETDRIDSLKNKSLSSQMYLLCITESNLKDPLLMFEIGLFYGENATLKHNNLFLTAIFGGSKKEINTNNWQSLIHNSFVIQQKDDFANMCVSINSAYPSTIDINNKLDDIFEDFLYQANIILEKTNVKIPDGFIVFISGVPGIGKTTISYELLKHFDEFRIIEETDIVREILRGYGEFLENEHSEKVDFLKSIDITDHTVLLNINNAKRQCNIMKKSIEKIVVRQKRKGISSIINGVHIIPECLDGIAENHNIIYLNLYINNENEIRERLAKRESQSYMLKYKNHINDIYQTNINLKKSTSKMLKRKGVIFNNIDVTDLNIKETITEIIQCIKRRLEYDN